MYSFTRAISARRLLAEQLPALAGAMVVAELFYRFSSVTLNCLAFLATWYIFDWLIATACDSSSS